MTPEARIGAAIVVLDRVLAGEPAERALTTWARASRFAGSRDRAAIRDHVYDVLRRRRSAQALSGQAEPTGRALMIGLLVAQGHDPATVFTGQGYGPAPLSDGERAALAAAPSAGDLPEAVALDVPDWLAGPLRARLGDNFGATMALMQTRAPVFLRVNAARLDRAGATAALAAEGIATLPSHLANGALEVTEGASRTRSAQSYLSGLVELQDAASQAAVESLPLAEGQRVLDYCAGGGGKVLAMAARCRGTWFAHDADPRRMADLPARAERAGVPVRRITTPEAAALGPFDDGGHFFELVADHGDDLLLGGQFGHGHAGGDDALEAALALDLLADLGELALDGISGALVECDIQKGAGVAACDGLIDHD